MAIITPLTKQSIVYSDIPGDFLLSPVNFDLTRRVNEDTVKQSITNILFTNKGERLMRPAFGGGISATLFENLTPVTVSLVEDNIKETLKLFEPRADIISVSVDSEIDSNDVDITITFKIINNIEPISFTVTLNRVR